jgi:hypothetical protein
LSPHLHLFAPRRSPVAEPPRDQPVSRRCRDIDGCRISEVDLLLDHAAAGLTRHFDGTFADESVRRCIAESYDLLALNTRIHTIYPF